MNKMREEFEVWHSECSPVKAEFKDGAYNDAMIEMAWLIWQASRKALVVDLPQPNNDGEDSLMRRVEIALDKVGVKY